MTSCGKIFISQTLKYILIRLINQRSNTVTKELVNFITEIQTIFIIIYI